jgi:glyoxylase I family protein
LVRLSTLVAVGRYASGVGELSGLHHAALTVSDVEASASWYADLLGMQVVLSGDDEQVSFRVLAHVASGTVVGLRQYHQPARAQDRFDEFRVGLDHLALGVPSRAALERWQDELERRRVTYTPIVETSIGHVIVFRDPDGIQLEFWLPAGG